MRLLSKVALFGVIVALSSCASAKARPKSVPASLICPGAKVASVMNETNNEYDILYAGMIIGTIGPRESITFVLPDDRDGSVSLRYHGYPIRIPRRHHLHNINIRVYCT
jgi:hypothetical protein